MGKLKIKWVMVNLYPGICKSKIEYYTKLTFSFLVFPILVIFIKVKDRITWARRNMLVKFQNWTKVS